MKKGKRHICCDGECSHDDCCGKVSENCTAPQPDWRERLRDEFGVTGLIDWKDIYKVEALIEQELERADQKGYEKGRLRCLQHHFPEELANQKSALLKQVKEIIEGMENVEDTEAKGWEMLEEPQNSCCPGDDAWLGYETALKELLKVLDGLN